VGITELFNHNHSSLYIPEYKIKTFYSILEMMGCLQFAQQKILLLGQYLHAITNNTTTGRFSQSIDLSSSAIIL